MKLGSVLQTIFTDRDKTWYIWLIAISDGNIISYDIILYRLLYLYRVYDMFTNDDILHFVWYRDSLS